MVIAANDQQNSFNEIKVVFFHIVYLIFSYLSNFSSFDFRLWLDVNNQKRPRNPSES